MSSSRERTVRVALGQAEPVLGAVEENTRQSIELMGQARADGVDLLVLPELMLTGYALSMVSDDVSRSLDDPELEELTAASKRMACVTGFAEAGPVHNYNSAAYIEDGVVRHVHRKLFLPTYGVWEERKHFTPGNGLRAFETAIGRVAILVCSDAWQPALAVVAVQDGARMLVVPANSTGLRPEIAREWHDINRFYARMLETYVVFVNRVGSENGLEFWGGSHVYDPWGELVAEAPVGEAALVSVDIDLANVRRRRREMPLVKEARLALLSRELNRLADEGGDL